MTDDWTTAVEPFPTTIKFPAEGSTFEGTYLRTDMVDLADEKTGEVRPTKLYVFTQGEENDKYSLWDSYNLSKAFDKIQPGMLVRITSGKTVDIKGGRSVKEYTVQFKNA